MKNPGAGIRERLTERADLRRHGEKRKMPIQWPRRAFHSTSAHVLRRAAWLSEDADQPLVLDQVVRKGRDDSNLGPGQPLKGDRRKKHG